MKKTVLIFALMVLFVFSAFGASAANYYPAEDNAGNYSYTIKCDVSALEPDDAEAVVNGESMYGLVAVLGTGDSISLASADSYVYIDQATIDANGYVTFSGFLPMGESPDEYDAESDAEGDNDGILFQECTLFIGGPGFNTAKELGVLKNASGVPVTGTIVDTFAPAKTATVTVIISEGNEVSAEAEADGSFAVTVPAGENYSVKFTKDAYLKLTYTGVNASTAIDLGDVSMAGLAGDIDESGQVEPADLTALLTDFFQPTANLQNPNSDLDASGQVEPADLTALLTAFFQEDKVVPFAAQ